MKWIETITPKQAVEELGMPYHGWMREMDRAWISDDAHYSVMSRLLRTEWGKVEHVTITAAEGVGQSDGSGDIPWAVKMQIKNELFGEKRLSRLKQEAMKNYEQYLGWVVEGGEDWALNNLKRCVEAALQEELTVLDHSHDAPTYGQKTEAERYENIAAISQVASNMAAERGVKRVPLAVLSQSEISRRMKAI